MGRHALQTQFPPSDIELRNSPEFGLSSLHSVLITAAARNPIDTIATQINGHSTANQKEIFRSDFSEMGFLFMPLSQAFEDRHFKKSEIYLLMLQGITTKTAADDYHSRLIIHPRTVSKLVIGLFV